MDSAFEVPGIGIRFGLDSVLGLLPGAGDLATSLASIYILNSAHQNGVPRITLTRMTLNIAIDLVVGAIPIAGDVFDVYWKSNQRNVELLRRHLVANPATARNLRMGDRLFVAGLIGLICILVCASVVLGYFALKWFSAAIYRGIS